MTTPSAFSPDAESAGRRALRNAALTYLVLCRGQSRTGAKAAFAAANNMTDLSACADDARAPFPGQRRSAKAALAAFRARFADNALVIDKWFSIQATIPGHGTLDRVKTLMREPLFNGSQSEPRAVAGRHLRLRQPDRLQPRRW